MILARVLLYLSAAGASVALWRRGRLTQVRPLSLDEEGRRRFDQLLAQYPRAPVSLVVDTVEEQFRDEALPRARGADQREMARRRLGQLMAQTPYRAALRQGPAGKGREHYLFMGLTSFDPMRPWLDIIRERKAPLAGIWLAPALSQQLLARLGLAADRLLLVSEQTGGLRLSYVEAGRLRFSRLAPVDNALFENPLEGYGDEIERTRQYLLSQRLLSREETLRVYLIDPLNTLSELHAMLPESAGFRCETLARPRLLADLGLPPSLLAESTDALYLNLLPHAPREANLQPPEQRAAYQGFLLRAGLFSAGGLWLLLCALASAFLLADAWRQNRAADEQALLASQTLARERQLAGSARAIEALRTRLLQLEGWRHATHHDASPTRDYLAALAATGPGTRLTQLAWRAAGEGGARELRLTGEISPFDGDYRAAHARVAALAARLREGGWRVVVEHWPMDTAPDKPALGEFNPGAGRAPLGFRLFLRHGPADGPEGARP